MNAELEKWIKEHSYRCDKHGTKDFAYIDDLRALFDGKVLAPVEPTEAMLDAAEQVDWANSDTKACIINMLQAMLAAAKENGE